MKFATWVQADCTLDFTGLDRQPKGMHCPFPLFVGALLGSFLLGQTLLGDHHEGETHPIKALLVTGGCCHNYPAQTQALQEGLSLVPVDRHTKHTSTAAALDQKAETVRQRSPSMQR